jgi:hypothetical protein
MPKIHIEGRNFAVFMPKVIVNVDLPAQICTVNIHVRLSTKENAQKNSAIFRISHSMITHARFLNR